MKVRHILLAGLAVLAIAFLQPLVTFVGGLTLLLGVGALIFRDLPPVGQEAVERRVLGWLRRARGGAAESDRTSTAPRQIPTPAEPGLPGQRPRRIRTRGADPAHSTSGGSTPPGL